MNLKFKAALDAEQIIPSVFPNGEPFIVDGVQYYQATQNGFNLSIGRFHAFGDVLKRHDELRITGDVLESQLAALNSMFRRILAHASTNGDQVVDAAREGLGIVERLDERRKLGLSMEQVYEIASIFHFHEDEDPAMIDHAINQKKILSWLNSPDNDRLFSFFLAMPVANYFDARALSDLSTMNSLKEQAMKELVDWSITLLKSKMNGTNEETMSIIESRRAILSGLTGLLIKLSNPILITSPPSSEPNE